MIIVSRRVQSVYLYRLLPLSSRNYYFTPSSLHPYKTKPKKLYNNTNNTTNIAWPSSKAPHHQGRLLPDDLWLNNLVLLRVSSSFLSSLSLFLHK